MLLAEIQAPLASIKTATDIVQLIRSAELSLKEAGHKMQLADLIGALAEAKINAAEIQELILEKDRRIRELEQVADIANRLKYEAPHYWLVDGQRRDGPFCQQWWDNDRKLIRLQMTGSGLWQCKSCANYFGSRSSGSEPETVIDFDPRGKQTHLQPVRSGRGKIGITDGRIEVQTDRGGGWAGSTGDGYGRTLVIGRSVWSVRGQEGIPLC